MQIAGPVQREHHVPPGKLGRQAEQAQAARTGNCRIAPAIAAILRELQDAHAIPHAVDRERTVAIELGRQGDQRG